MDFQSPIIIIGSGRSGTTLLARLLDSHREIDFKGETAFLVPRLWLEIWVDRFWFNWERYNATRPQSSREPMPSISEEVLDAERARIGGLIASLVASTLGADCGSRYWGFKEIWNGSSWATYDWAYYDAVFPRAMWVNMLRHPFDFVSSNAQWNLDTLDLPFLRNQLQAWTSMVKYNRLRNLTGRYAEVRYEDLVADPKATLAPVFDELDLTWDETCLKAMKSWQMSSHKPARRAETVRLGRKKIAAIVNGIPDLPEMMGQFGYKLPEQFEVQAKPAVKETDEAEYLNLHAPHGEPAPRNMPQFSLHAELQATISASRVREEQEKPIRSSLRRALRDLRLGLARWIPR